MKLNNKGMSIIEIVLTFALIMAMVIGMFTIIMNYRDKASLSLKKLEMDTFKNTLTKDIQDDILNLGVKEINTDGECSSIQGLSHCINIVYRDDSEKAFGTSKVDANNKDSVENKFIYYDGEKYKLRDSLPDKIPSGRNILDFQSITVEDNNILTTDSTILSNGEEVDIYSIDVYVSHVDFDQDFGIHIVAVSDEDLDDEINEDTGKFKEKILTNNNVITAKPNLTTTSNNAGDSSGLYKSMSTNSGKPTYYFRGNVENNYVSFAGFTWKIIRINEDGTVRIIMTEGINNNTIYQYSNNPSDYNSSYYSNSNAKTQLDNWYNTNLTKYDSYIADGSYCEAAKTVIDDTHSNTLGNTTLTPIGEYNPTFKCLNDSNNYGKLTAKIGLITYDEVVYAGGYADTVNANYYLNIPSSRHILTMNSCGLRTSANIYDIWFVRNWSLINSGASFQNGYLSATLTNETSSTWGGSLVPVINIKADVEAIGTGTSSDPYVIGETINEKILNNNTIITANPTLTTSSNNTKDTAGLYKSTDTNSGNPTYYFRGNVTNNYVSFADQTWRIVRINEDGSVRLILQTGINSNKTYAYGTSDKNYYTESNAKTIVDDWYNTNLINYDSYILTGNYCEEYRVLWNESYTSDDATAVKFNLYTPTFKCATDGNGYGVVNAKVGLITYDEALYAGAYPVKKNNSYYLYNGSTTRTMSPSGRLNNSIKSASTWELTSSSYSLSYSNNTGAKALRPVINLKANAVVIDGTGTKTDPYKIGLNK